MMPHDRMETVPLTPRESSDGELSTAASLRAQRSTYLSFFRSPPNASHSQQQHRSQNQSTLHPVRETPTYENQRQASGPLCRATIGWNNEVNNEDDDSDDSKDSQTTAPGYLAATVPRPSSTRSSTSSVFSSVSAAYSERIDEHLSQISSQSHLFGEPLLLNETQYEEEEIVFYDENEDVEQGRVSGSSCETISVTSRQVNETHASTHRQHYFRSSPRYSASTSSSMNYQSPSILTRFLSHRKVLPLTSSLRLGGAHHPAARPSLSPRSKNLQDLDYLVQKHEEKVEQLQVIPQEHYDYCLILKPQNVYGYWAEILDFRQELLGLDAVDEMDIGMDGKIENNENELVRDMNDLSMTPTSALLRRRRGNFAEQQPMTPDPATGSFIRRQNIFTTPGLESTSSTRVSTITTARKSVFERAIGSPMAAEIARSSLRLHQFAVTGQAHRQQKDTPFRRRWGAGLVSSTPSAISPPIRSLTRGTSAAHITSTGTTKPKLTVNPAATPLADNEAVPTFSPRDINELRMEDIPPQRFARGIAARTNGMLPFLGALRRGIVVRKHRPNQEAVFCRLYSDDGGDTVRFTILSNHDEALNAFKEQRVRYNKVKYGGEGAGEYDVEIQSWSRGTIDGEDNDRFSIPDYVAAQKYREKLARERQGVGTRVHQLAANVVRAGVIRAADIAVVHPGVFNDPRSDHGEMGTSTLRRSKSDYDPKFTFSLVLRNERLIKRGQSVTIDESEGKWLSGEGGETQFRYHDFETATLGEYWLIFRGFLLLHRDAAVGRFAAMRAAGIGSHYNRLEMEQRVQTQEDDHNVLNPDAFVEPKTAGLLERTIVKRRGLDTTYLEGYVQPGAVPPPSDYFLGFRSPGTAIWSRLRFAGLETCRVYSLDPNRVMIKIRCPPERMLDVAEVLRVKLRTKEGTFAPFREDMMDLYQNLDDNLEIPPGCSTGEYPFRSSIRDSIIDFIVGSRIRDSGSELAQNTELGKMILARVPLHMQTKLDAIYDNWLYFWREENWKGPSGWYTSTKFDWADKVHDLQKAFTMNSASSNSDTGSSGDVEKLIIDKEPPHFWKRFILGCFYQPLDSIEQYFGEKVAFYFAWMQHTATHLVFLSFFGLIQFFLQLSSGNWDHPLRPLFAMIVMLWTFLVLVNWKKRANLLAYHWGTLNYKQQEVTRPQFKGEYARDEVTGEWIVTYARWKRWLKYLISVPLTLIFTFGALFLILGVHANRDLQLDKYYSLQNSTDTHFQFENDFRAAIGRKKIIVDTKVTTQQLQDPAFWFIIIGMPSLLGLFLPLVNLVLMKISVMLNDFENYRTETEYRTWLIIKVFSFRFVCYFATLYYYAFLSTGSEQAIENGILRVASGILIYTTVAQWWQNFLQVCFPMLIRHLRMRHRNNRLINELRAIEIEEEEIDHLLASGQQDDDIKIRQIRLINKRLLLDHAQDDVWLEVMKPMHDSFPEYIQAVVQFTFCSCFSVVLPITPFLCLINYLISMRLDAYKLCKGRRRPMAEKTGGIGIWEHLMHIVAVISVLTNCWLMGFTTATLSRIGEEIGTLALFAFVVAWEHIMLLIKYMMQTSMSPLPKKVRDAIKREQYELDKQKSSFMRSRRVQHQREHDAAASQDQAEASNSPESTIPNAFVMPATYNVQTILSEDQDDEFFGPRPHNQNRTSVSTAASTHYSGKLSVG
ncbi:hypothetical protein MPSEU_000420700 [Mayamaea pseudoterrestris]|nr:hypothetical protein MPSEU_000420700 [Mayamaea pseudoterrestris]